MSLRSILPLAASFAAGLVFAGTQQVEYSGWNLDKEREQVKRREDPATWFTETFEADKENMKEVTGRPLAFGVFPAPRYDLVGVRSFRGAGTTRTRFERKNGRLVHGNAFFNVRSPVNEKFIGDHKDEVFFQILVLSDRSLKSDNAASQIVSRNHPHIIGQGMYEIGTIKIDYVAFITAERQAFAIVDMRLFDLRAGRTVLIAPQKDGTLRSMQVDSPIMPSADVQDYQAKLLQEPSVVKFLDQPGNL